MITEDYVSFEIAKLLKEKGYKGSFDGYYNDAGCVVNRPNVFLKEPKYQYYERVSLYMAMKWLREVHNVFIYIEPFITASGLQGYKPYCTKIGGEFMWINPLRKYSNTSSDTYEEAVESVIKYCLENLI